MKQVAVYEAGEFRLFTLIELLVVIAVIGILTSLLLPALGHAKRVVKLALCASNLRQNYIGLEAYVGDYNDWMPNSGWSAGYVYYISDYLKLQDGGPNSVRIDNTYKLVYFSKNSPLNTIVHCPSMSSPPECSPLFATGGSWTAYLPGYNITFSYNTNANGGGYYRGGTARKFTTVKGGSVIISDKDWTGVTSGWLMQATVIRNWPYDMTSVSSPGYNHDRKANFLFIDGHVSSYKYVPKQLFDDDFIPKF